MRTWVANRPAELDTWVLVFVLIVLQRTLERPLGFALSAAIVIGPLFLFGVIRRSCRRAK